MRYVALLFFLLVSDGWAQGPQVSYYYNPSTELSWAQCYVYQQGGSHEKIPFLPVVGRDHSPLGTLNYTKDVNINGTVVFAGDGIADGDQWNSYSGRRLDYTRGPIDIARKIVMFCYDFPDSVETRLGKTFPVERRIATAAAHDAAAVILFSHQRQYPFLYLDYPTDSVTRPIPVITVTETSAAAILESAGMDTHELLEQWQKSQHPPESQVLISRLHLWIEGTFQSVQTKYFSLHARKEEFSRRDMQSIARVNQKAQRFVRKLFNGVPLQTERLFIVYFRDYDSKVFYTHHWGKGFATNASIFNVHEGGVPSFGLAVHENTHLLWGTNSTSFLDEGVAMYAQAMATDRNSNDRKTLQLMKSNKLYPLQEMMKFQIGIPGTQTDVGYPAAGSFVRFLIDRYGLKSFHDVFLLESRPENEIKGNDSWEKVYHKPVPQLEAEWHQYLLKRSRDK